MMTGNNIKVRIFSIFMAIFISGACLAIMPSLSQNETFHTAKPFFDAIVLTNYEEPPQKPHKEKPKPKKEEILKNIPKVSIKHKKLNAKQPKMEFKVPLASFEINPMLKTDLNVQMPEPVPVISQPAQVMQSVSVEFGIGEVDESPKIIRKVEPLYPYNARRRNISGKVIVKFLVDKKGKIKKLSIIESDPKGIFEKSALTAVNKWHFSPGYYQGKPVLTWVVLPINFQLRN
ncbi:periplasmic protein TonB [Candidatus Magnetomoraceae bacterium gMMP-1]